MCHVSLAGSREPWALSAPAPVEQPGVMTTKKKRQETQPIPQSTHTRPISDTRRVFRNNFAIRGGEGTKTKWYAPHEHREPLQTSQ